MIPVPILGSVEGSITVPDKIQVNEDLGIIEVESFGKVSFDDISQSIANVRQIHVEKKLSKILVDTRKQEVMPDTMGIFDLFSTFPNEFTLALLVERSQATERDISFAETVGANRGVRVRMFYEIEPARQWLNG